MADESMFVPEGEDLHPTEWAVGPWSADTLQASAYGGLLVRQLEYLPPPADMTIARLSFDLWRPVTRRPIRGHATVLREGRKAQTVETSLIQDDKPVARCTAVLLKADRAATPPARASLSRRSSVSGVATRVTARTLAYEISPRASAPRNNGRFASVRATRTFSRAAPRSSPTR